MFVGPRVLLVELLLFACVHNAESLLSVQSSRFFTLKPVAITKQEQLQFRRDCRWGDPLCLSSAAADSSFSDADDEAEILPNRRENLAASSTKPTMEEIKQVFNELDVDGSGGLCIDEFNQHLAPAGYSKDEIQSSFSQMDFDGSGTIDLDEFKQSILQASEQDECPRGYFLNSVKQACVPLGPLGCVSQRVETLGPFKRTYTRISNLFGVDTKRISKLGVSFALSYSIISNLNGALSLSAAWYISCKRTGLSPLVPGQWKNLFSSYAMIYGFIQIFKPFRVAAAVAMSKLSAEYLEMTQAKLNCSRTVAIACQYAMGLVGMAACASIGITIVSVITGVPIFGVD